MKLKNIKDSSVYITPNFPVIETKRYKFSLFSILGVIAIYTFIIAVIVITLLAVTPLKNAIFIFENEKLTEQAAKVKKLEAKVIFLSKELEKMASANEKLKYAIILGSTEVLDSNSAVYDSLKKTDRKNLNFGGNILIPIRKLLEGSDSVEYSNDESIYFIKPAEGIIIKKFDPATGHFGVDFGVKNNSSVYAALGGTVTFADYTAEDGYVIIVSTMNDYTLVYKHCSTLLKKVRDKVHQGELIALSGNSGFRTTGPHLHFEIWENGKAVDPLKFIVNP